MTKPLAHVDGYILSIDDDHDVWLDTDVAIDGSHDGLCLGAGKTTRDALKDAGRVLSELQDGIAAAVLKEE